MDLFSPLDYSRGQDERAPERPVSDTPARAAELEVRRPELDREPSDSRCPRLEKQVSAGRARLVRADGRTREIGAPSQPRRPKRSRTPAHAMGLHTRPEEQALLQEVGKFRVIATRDLAEPLYGSHESRLRQDLDFLKKNGLIETHVLNARRDNPLLPPRKFEVATLTRAGKRLISETGEIPTDQRLYSGLVKPREAEHDAQVYRAYRKELDSISKSGGSNPRVRLDFELKQRVNRAVYIAQKKEPDRDVQEIKNEIAQQFEMNVVDGKIAIPDLRIEYDLPSGGSTHSDVEVATAAYRRGHLAAKARSGFKIYASSHDIGRLGAAVQDDHDIMSEILSL